MDQKVLERYAEMLIKDGLALQPGQRLKITTNLDALDFAHMAARAAFAQGARDVQVDITDDVCTRLRVNGADPQALQEMPEWQDMKSMEEMEGHDCLLSLHSPNRKASQGIDNERLALSRKNRSETQRKMTSMIGGDKLRWCVAAVPNAAWAAEIFPELSAQEGIEKLWQDILHCCYMNHDGGWAGHVKDVISVRERINELDLRSLHFTSGLGTDLHVRLIPGACWQGGAAKDPEGVVFSPNIPSEEIYTSPDKWGTEGVVVTSKPLVLAGEQITGLHVTFKEGRVTQVEAESGAETFLKRTQTDENAAYLGEVALVSSLSPIYQKGYSFCSTLFDENAACHLAVGTGFVSVLDGSLTKEEREKKGLNESVIHLDFMFGTQDLRCVGINAQNEEIVIMENGRFVI